MEEVTMVERPNTHRLADASRPPMRPPHLVLGILVGAAIGFAIGTFLVLTVNQPHLTGSRTHGFTYLFGLPGLLSIPGAVFGALFYVARYADDADAPVRVDEQGRPGVDPSLASATAERQPAQGRSGRAGRPPRRRAMPPSTSSTTR
jgi:hypothetical protein